MMITSEYQLVGLSVPFLRGQLQAVLVGFAVSAEAAVEATATSGFQCRAIAVDERERMVLTKQSRQLQEVEFQLSASGEALRGLLLRRLAGVLPSH
jgi:hypothetical protein